MDGRANRFDLASSSLLLVVAAFWKARDLCRAAGSRTGTHRRNLLLSHPTSATYMKWSAVEEFGGYDERKLREERSSSLVMTMTVNLCLSTAHSSLGSSKVQYCVGSLLWDIVPLPYTSISISANFGKRIKQHCEMSSIAAFRICPVIQWLWELKLFKFNSHSYISSHFISISTYVPFSLAL